MRAEAAPSRGAGLAATATTLVALLAVASTSAIVPSLRTVPAEVRTAYGETPAVRMVTAVVIAVARDLMPSGSVDDAAPPAQGCGLVAPRVATGCVVRGERGTGGVRPLDERLLDLPPPAC